MKGWGRAYGLGYPQQWNAYTRKILTREPNLCLKLRESHHRRYTMKGGE